MKQHVAAHIQNGTGEDYKNDLIIIGSQEFLANDEVCIKPSYILCFFNPYIAGKFLKESLAGLIFFFPKKRMIIATNNKI